MGNKEIIMRQPHLFLIIPFIVMLIFAFIFISFSNNHPSTPDAVFLEHLDRINDRDIDGALDLTLMKFATEENYQQHANQLRIWIVQIESHSANVVTKVKMTNDQHSQAESYIDTYILNYDDFYVQELTIEDYCIVHSSHTFYYSNGDVKSETVDGLCVMIDGKWYFANFLEYVYGDPE